MVDILYDAISEVLRPWADDPVVQSHLIRLEELASDPEEVQCIVGNISSHWLTLYEQWAQRNGPSSLEDFLRQPSRLAWAATYGDMLAAHCDLVLHGTCRPEVLGDASELLNRALRLIEVSWVNETLPRRRSDWAKLGF